MMKHKLLLPILLIVCATSGAQTPQSPSKTPVVLSRAEDSPAISGSVSDEPKAPADETKLPADETGELSVHVGKSLLVNSPETLHRVSVTNPEIASATVITPTQILIHGHKPGAVTLLLWDQQDRPRSFNLNVEFDTPSIRDAFHETFPQEKISVRQSGASLVLTGNVSAKPVGDQAAALAGTFGAANVVNLLQVNENRQIVLLQVKFAEVDRAAIQQYGLNLFSTGATGTIGAVSTQQFEQFLAGVGAVPANVQRGTDPKSPNTAAGGIGNPLSSSPSVFGLSDLLNIFLFRPDLNLGAAIKALQQRNVLQILAEPNVMALNGREASFLAGGEFPFPVVQSSVAGNSISIVFKEFGVRLNFLPQVLPDGSIRLKVRPEVSSLDFSNALTVSGFLIPALSTRRAETEVELRDGQSFAIAGLMDNRLSEIGSKVPGLGNIPIVGNFFKSRATNKTNSELLVTVTPRLVQPISPGQEPPPPQFPKPFLDQNSFDGKAGETPAKRSATPIGSPADGQARVATPEDVR
jgi:pilus assembly protein CpaC